MNQTWILWKSEQWKTYITYGHKCSFACIFYTFLSIGIEFRRGDAYINSLSGCEFCENWRSESHALLKGVREFTSVLSTSISNLGEVSYKVSEHNAVEHLWVLWKSAQGRPYVSYGINKITFMCIPMSFIVPPLHPPAPPDSSLGWGLAACCKYCNKSFIWDKFMLLMYQPLR